MTTTATRLLTADDMLRGRWRGDLIRGVLHQTKPAGLEHGEIVVRLSFELGCFIKPRKLGSLTVFAGFWLERGPDTVLGADVAYISAAKIPLGVRITGYAEVSPDLVAEVVSPNDSRREVSDKARMWLSYGVALVWVVQPDSRTVDVHGPGRAVVTLDEHDTLDGLDALPGFTCAVSEIFDT